MKLLRLSSVLLLTGLLGLAGCTAHKPIPLYQLDNGNAAIPTQTQGLAVLLGPVSVADYLQRETLLQRQSDGSLLAATDARWRSSNWSMSAARLPAQRASVAASRLPSLWRCSRVSRCR
jgi:uncharacterized lipoprotein YmbA